MGKPNLFPFSGKGVRQYGSNKRFHLWFVIVIVVFCLTRTFNVALAIDDDQDGMSDVWQRTYNIPTGSTNDDFDGDLFPNVLENYFGTNPRLNGYPTQLLDTCGLPIITTNNGFIAARWRSVPGIRYQLQRSTNLVDWVNAGSPLVGTGGIVTITSTGFPATTTPALFYRLASLPPNDADGDGLNAFEESLLGTSDLKTDTDGDHVSDLTEFRLGLNPASAASLDGDVIPDDWEIFHFGSSAALPNVDTDNDGFTNLEEFQFDLDPNQNDFANGIVTHIYTYDKANRLTGVNSVLVESFSYDAENNLTNSQ